MKEKMWAAPRFFTALPKDLIDMEDDEVKTAPTGVRKGF